MGRVTDGVTDKGADVGKPEVIFFDAAGTLFDVRGSVGEIYARVARRHGIEADGRELEASFRKAFREKSSEGFASDWREGLRAEKAWWRDVVRRVFAGRTSDGILEEYFADVFEAFRGGGAWVRFDDVPYALERLLAEGYRLAVISNFDSRLYDVLRNLDLERYFEKIILSWHAGAAKPDARIFRAALELMHVSARCSVHVGDSPRDDLSGARAAGLRAVLIDRTGRHSEQHPRIETLARLPDYLREPPEN